MVFSKVKFSSLFEHREEKTRRVILWHLELPFGSTKNTLVISC